MSNIAPALIATATIANGASLSGAVEVASARPIGLALPTITSAVITFQGSHDGVTFYDAVDLAGAEITLGAATTGAKYFSLPDTLRGVAWLKIRSGTSAAPVAQGAQRDLQLVSKAM
jgi:hypothetical protein